jgi:LPXTG-motif cell wall-anchored protein
MNSSEIDQSIYNTAIEQGFNPIAAKLIAAQARFESADYTSSVFKANNNTSGIKYIGQANSTQGSISPEGNYYAKFDTIQDSINDKIVRLYNKTIQGITPQQLKDSTDADDFARKLKQRGYYGNAAYGTSESESDISNYSRGMKAKLLKIKVLEFYNNNKNTINFAIIGVTLIAITFYIYYIKKKKLI